MIEELRSKQLSDLAESLSSDLACLGYRNHIITIHDDDLATKVVLIKGKGLKPAEMILHLIESLPEPLKKQVDDALKEKYKGPSKTPYELLRQGYFEDE